jgi:tetratricopeptide (TPR) repeat protein
MMQRPRSHQLEDESWKALSNSIPHHWVLRKPQPDYGIDGEVEIFDESGSSTGLLFFVQLKGTDTKEKAKALSCRIQLKTLSYYKSLPVPVLLIRYHSPSKSLYFRWFGTIDPYYTRKGSKTIKVDFSDETRWSEETPGLLVEQLKFFQRFTAPVISLPIEFRFEFPNKEVFSFPVSIVESIIRETGRSVSEIISFSSGSHSLTLSPRIKITNDLILIEIEGLKSFNLHVRRGYSKEEVKTKLPHAVFIGISFVLYLLGQINIAAEIASKHILSSGILSNQDLIFEIASCFFLARRVDMALKLSEQLLDMGEQYRFAYRIFSLPAFKKVHMDEVELESFKKVLLKAIDKAKEAGNLVIAAESHYNLGNRIRGGGLGKDREALCHYLKAAKYDPTYKKRDYFWSEVGGILFHLNKFSCSERFYSKAIEIGAGTECMALRADALMFAGKYREAYELFEEHSKVAKKIEDEWALKSWILGGLIKTLGIETQKRRPNDAIKIADIKELPPEEVEKRISQTLSLDALCGLAWFNNGVHMVSKKEYSDAVISFLIAAVVQPNDIEAWSNTVICNFNCPEFVYLLPSVLSVAYEKNGEEFVSKFSLDIEKQPHLPDWVKTEIVNRVGEYTRSLPKKEKLPILRLIKPDGTYVVIDTNLKSIKNELEEISFPEFPGMSFLEQRRKDKN